MAIHFQCDKCGRSDNAPDKLAGRIVKCPDCGHSFQVGAANSYSPHEPIAAPSLAPDLPPLPDATAYDVRLLGEDQQFEYMMVQIPPTIVVTQTRGNDAAAYLESIVNIHAKQGWDFYRVDQIGVQVAPGCLAALAGMRAETVSHYVVTFRRKVTA